MARGMLADQQFDITLCHLTTHGPVIKGLARGNEFGIFAAGGLLNAFGTPRFIWGGGLVFFSL